MRFEQVSDVRCERLALCGGKRFQGIGDTGGDANGAEGPVAQADGGLFVDSLLFAHGEILFAVTG